MTTYDEWKLASPDDDRHQIGHDDGETCGRYEEPDEDAPRRYRPKPCAGVMVYSWAWCGAVECDTCGEIGY